MTNPTTSSLNDQCTRLNQLLRQGHIQAVLQNDQIHTTQVAKPKYFICWLISKFYKPKAIRLQTVANTVLTFLENHKTEIKHSFSAKILLTSLDFKWSKHGDLARRIEALKTQAGIVSTEFVINIVSEANQAAQKAKDDAATHVKQLEDASEKRIKEAEDQSELVTSRQREAANKLLESAQKKFDDTEKYTSATSADIKNDWAEHEKELGAAKLALTKLTNTTATITLEDEGALQRYLKVIPADFALLSKDKKKLPCHKCYLIKAGFFDERAMFISGSKPNEQPRNSLFSTITSLFTRSAKTNESDQKQQNDKSKITLDLTELPIPYPAELLNILLEFIYNNKFPKVALNIEKLIELWGLAEWLNFPALKTVCQISLDELLASNPSLISHAFRYIWTNNAVDSLEYFLIEKMHIWDGFFGSMETETFEKTAAELIPFIETRLSKIESEQKTASATAKPLKPSRKAIWYKTLLAQFLIDAPKTNKKAAVKLLETILITEKSTYLNAQYLYYFCLSEGVGIAKNMNRANEFYALALSQQHALCLYSEVYKLSETNIKIAHDYLLQAANKGDFRAQYRLGILLRKGAEGIPQDIPEAIKWLTKAAAHKHKLSMDLLQKMQNVS